MRQPAAPNDLDGVSGHGVRTEFANRKLSGQQSVDREGIELIKQFLFEGIMTTDEFRLLSGRSQMGAMSYTSQGRDESGQPIPGRFDHKRDMHSWDVAEISLERALEHGYSFDQALILATVSLCHDLGQAEFSHTGEDVLHEFGLKNLNHDLFTVMLLSTQKFKGIFDEWGVSIKTCWPASQVLRFLRKGLSLR